MSDDEQDRQRREEFEQSLEAMRRRGEQLGRDLRSHLNVCGMSAAQSDAALDLVQALMLINQPCLTILDQNRAEANAHYAAKIARWEASEAEEEQRKEREEEERARVHDAPAYFYVRLCDTVEWDITVKAKSEKEAEEIALKRYHDLSHEKWHEHLDRSGTEPEITYCKVVE